jgi:hypothetical protein
LTNRNLKSFELCYSDGDPFRAVFLSAPDEVPLRRRVDERIGQPEKLPLALLTQLRNTFAGPFVC